MDLKEYIMQLAIREVEKLRKNDEFVVADLFRRADWEIIPLDIRQQIGLAFYDYFITKKNSPQLKALGKSGGGQQIYSK